METSQLFARTLAGIEPEWIVELAAHLVKTTVDQPYWDPRAGQVLAVEKTFLYGLRDSGTQGGLRKHRSTARD